MSCLWLFLAATVAWWQGLDIWYLVLFCVASFPTGEPEFLTQLRSPRKGREAARPLKGLSLELTQLHFH